jgi:hypothetical protein
MEFLFLCKDELIKQGSYLQRKIPNMEIEFAPIGDALSNELDIHKPDQM